MRFFSRHKGLSASTTFERREQRHSTFTIVEIKNEQGSLLERASLRDLSANGAMIHVATRQPLPDTIIVDFPADRMNRSAKIRWQEEQFIGVEFDDPVDMPERIRSRRSRAEVIASHFKQHGAGKPFPMQAHVSV